MIKLPDMINVIEQALTAPLASLVPGLTKGLASTSVTGLPVGLYAAGAIGAVGLYLLMRPAETPGGKQARILGTLVGLAGLALLFVQVLAALPPVSGVPIVSILLGTMAVACATRMVTHQKPVFAALYFILVVVSSAGLFLTLHAEFMAFALIIVYAGAILITYMFVLMLAQQTPNEGDVEGGTRYDRVPREPFPAVVVGFTVLAALTHAYFAPLGGPPSGGAGAGSATAYHESPNLLPIPEDRVAEATETQWQELAALPRRLAKEVKRVEPAMEGDIMPVDGQLIRVENGNALVRVMVNNQPKDVVLPASAMPTNTQSVGLALVARFPASLELASVILLMAMFGAVVLARKQIELGEDERREAVGMRRLSVDDGDFNRGGRS